MNGIAPHYNSLWVEEQVKVDPFNKMTVIGVSLIALASIGLSYAFPQMKFIIYSSALVVSTAVAIFAIASRCLVTKQHKNIEETKPAINVGAPDNEVLGTKKEGLDTFFEDDLSGDFSDEKTQKIPTNDVVSMHSVLKNYNPSGIDETIQETKPSPIFYQIPDELFLEIFSFLDLHPLHKCSHINKNCRDLIINNDLLKKFVHKHLAFGKNDWEEFYNKKMFEGENKAEDFDSLPKDIVQTLLTRLPNSNKKFMDRNVFVWVYNKVSGVEITWQTFHEAYSKMSDHSINIFDKTKTDLKIEKSAWESFPKEPTVTYTTGICSSKLQYKSAEDCMKKLQLEMDDYNERSIARIDCIKKVELEMADLHQRFLLLSDGNN